jgi:hypothetical protein
MIICKKVLYITYMWIKARGKLLVVYFLIAVNGASGFGRKFVNKIYL